MVFQLKSLIYGEIATKKKFNYIVSFIAILIYESIFSYLDHNNIWIKIINPPLQLVRVENTSNFFHVQITSHLQNQMSEGFKRYITSNVLLHFFIFYFCAIYVFIACYIIKSNV